MSDTFIIPEHRQDYLRRLISGVKEVRNRSEDYIKANNAYGQCIPADWVDITLLCNVIEGILDREDVYERRSKG